MTEIWKPIPGFNYYEASQFGRIRSLKNSRNVKILKPGMNGVTGYQHVSPSYGGKSKTKLVHRIIWAAFNGEIPAGMQINHINGIKQDNRLENLEIVTPSENIFHSVRLGLHPRCGAPKLSKEDSALVRFFYQRKNGEVESILARLFSVHRATIYRTGRSISRGKQ